MIIVLTSNGWSLPFVIVVVTCTARPVSAPAALCDGLYCSGFATSIAMPDGNV